MKGENFLIKLYRVLTSRCTYIIHPKCLVDETREDKGNGVVVISKHYKCPLCEYEWNEEIVIDPNYQIDFHSISDEDPKFITQLLLKLWK